MSQKLADIISKVQKMLRLAEQSNQPGEVAAAQSMAQELISRWQIEEYQLIGHISEEDIISVRIETPAPHMIDKAMLIGYITKYNFCKALRSNEGYCMLYGYKSDVEICIALYDNLSIHMVGEMAVKLKQAKDNWESKEKFPTKSWIKSFFGGYVISIGERFKESRDRVINETPGTSLEVIVREKEHAIEDFFQKIGKKKPIPRKFVSTEAFEAGKQSALKADLTRNKLEEG